MENTNYTAFGYGQFFLFLILLPTLLNVIKYLFNIGSSQIIYVEQPVETPSVVTSYTGDHIYRGDHVNGTKVINKTIKSKTKQQIKPKKKQNLDQVFGISKIPETKLDIKENSVIALKNLGFKMPEANKIIRKLCINKCYNREEELIADAISSIKNE